MIVDMSKFTQVPAHVDVELKNYLTERYPDLTEAIKNISYAESKSAKTRYTAEVVYYFEKTTATALVAYVECKDQQHGGYKYCWHCTRDWKD